MDAVAVQTPKVMEAAHRKAHHPVAVYNGPARGGPIHTLGKTVAFPIFGSQTRQPCLQFDFTPAPL